MATPWIRGWSARLSVEGKRANLGGKGALLYSSRTRCGYSRFLWFLNPRDNLCRSDSASTDGDGTQPTATIIPRLVFCCQGRHETLGSSPWLVLGRHPEIEA